MAEIVVEETRIIEDPRGDGSRLWGFITFWGLHAWVLAYCVVGDAGSVVRDHAGSSR